MKEKLKKINEFLVVYHTLISLIYWIVLFVIFGGIFKFHFAHGSSLLFLFLLILPLGLFVDAFLYYRKHQKRYEQRASRYFQRIKEEEKKGQLQKSLFEKDNEVFERNPEKELEYISSNFILGFNKSMGYLILKNYPVRYYYFYSRIADKKTPYDESGFEGQPPHILFEAMLSQMVKLKLSRLEIVQNKYGFLLQNKDTQERYYQMFKKTDDEALFEKKKKASFDVIFIENINQ